MGTGVDAGFEIAPKPQTAEIRTNHGKGRFTTFCAKLCLARGLTRVLKLPPNPQTAEMRTNHGKGRFTTFCAKLCHALNPGSKRSV